MMIAANCKTLTITLTHLPIAAVKLVKYIMMSLPSTHPLTLQLLISAALKVQIVIAVMLSQVMNGMILPKLATRNAHVKDAATTTAVMN